MSVINTKIISTVSSASAGAMLVYGSLGESLPLATVGALAFGGVGYSIAYVAIPKLLKKKMLGMASAIGFGMSLTWLMNGGTIYDVYFNTLCNKIDAKYHTYKESYKNSSEEVIDVKDKEKKVISLTGKIKEEEVSVDMLVNKTSKQGEAYVRLKEETETELLEMKNSNLKAWKKGKYKEVAKDYVCSNPTRINFKRLVSCATDYKFHQQTEGLLKQLSTTKEQIALDRVELDKIESSIKSIEKRANKSNALIARNKAKYEEIERKATEQGEQSKLYIYGVIWAFGLFIELISMMFNELVDARSKKIEEKEDVKNIEIMKEEIEKVYEEVVKREINREAMNRVISFANDESDPLKIMFRTKLKSGKRGKILAVSNSIMGAFLYAFTIKKDGIIDSWNGVTLSNILYVNGAVGTEFVGRKERRKLISEFYPNIDEGITSVKVLGSTATELKNKDIWAYLGNRGSINPQQEALDYLRDLEKADSDRFSPLNISVKDLEAVAIKFVARYHPNNFN